MSNLTAKEKRKLENLLKMESGYVLEFSNRTFSELFHDYKVEIDADIYEIYGTSKAKRMRAFWDLANNNIVGRVLEGIIDHAMDMQWLSSSNPKLIQDSQKIVQRLLNDNSVSELSALDTFNNDYDFEIVAEQIRTAINNNQPEAGLDRLHTFLIKFIKRVSQNHNIIITKEKPLHSLFGEYIKKLKKEGYIESQMTERILKSSISVLEAFNDVRNNKSLAHDNPILNYEESLLIFNHVSASIRFIKKLEENKVKIHSSPNKILF